MALPRCESPVTRLLLWYLCVAFTVMACGSGEAVAAATPPGQVGALSDGGRRADLARIQKTLELKLVRQRLADLGLTEDEIATRLARLDDEEQDRPEWLALMRHYGAPSRLADWTYSFWVAVYFAVEDASGKCAIWALDSASGEGSTASRRAPPTAWTR